MSAHSEMAGTGSSVSRTQADEAYLAAVTSYIETRHRRIPYFIERHFGVWGSLRIHRAALGWDLLRAPANIALAIPHLLKLLAIALSRRLGARSLAERLGRMQTQLRTNVEREIVWLIWTELLELPYREGNRTSDRDALAEILVAQPVIAEALSSLSGGTGGEAMQGGLDSARRTRVDMNLSRYTGARNATAEIATALASAGFGGVAVQQLTPTAISLGPPVAALLAHQAAVIAFPLGSVLGGLWYSLFPAAPSTLFVASVTGGLIVLSAAVAAFAGIAADPVQRVLGLHRRRLGKFVEAIGHDLAGEGEGRFKVRAHYVARLFDFFEAVRLAVRAAG